MFASLEQRRASAWVTRHRDRLHQEAVDHGRTLGYLDGVPPPTALPPDDIPPQSLPERHLGLGQPPVLKKKFELLDRADVGPPTYARYSFRVPAVIVSPFAKPGFVTKTLYDHTSTLRLIEEKWNFPAITRRDAAATSPTDIRDFFSPEIREPAC